MTSRHPWAVVSIVAAGLAVWIGLGTLHDYDHADSLLTVLISTQRWTPFFWGQDRFGMLVPLLAMPIRHPLANMLTQGWIMSSAALLAPFAVARFLTGRGGAWFAIGACTNLLFLLLTTPAVQFDWLVTQPYGLSISLGFAGLIVAEQRDRPGDIVVGLLLLALACWVNIGIVVMLAIAAVVRGPSAVRLLALQAIAVVAAGLAARYLPAAHTISALASVAQWPEGWRQLLENSAGVTDHRAVVVAVSAAAIAAFVWLWKTEALPTFRTTAAIVAMAIGTWLVLGTSLWVGMNRYSFRYVYPTLMMGGVGASLVFTAVFTRRATLWARVVTTALIGVATIRYGAPSIARVDRGLDARFGRDTAVIVRSGATVIAGDYWRVWPAVFHANLALARAHAHARVYGLSYRSEATDPLWKTAGREVLIAGSPDDPSVQAVAREHGVATK